MPLMAGTADLTVMPVWDTVITAAGANTPALFQFFTAPIGQAGKTKNETNLRAVGQLSAPQFMNVTHLGFAFSPRMIEVDIAQLLDAYYFEFKVGDEKIYAEGHLDAYPAGFGVHGVSTRNNVSLLGNGAPLVDNCRTLIVPMPFGDGATGIQILQGETFRVDLIGTPFALAAAAAPTNGTGLRLRCYLYGIRSRQVQ